MPLTLEKRTQTVFSGENLKPFSLAHLWSLFMVSCICRSQVFKFDEEYDIWISSTYRLYDMDGGISFEIEFILRINNVTLKTDPCGTPFSWTNIRDKMVPS